MRLGWKRTEEEPREQWEESSTREWGLWLLFEELGKVGSRVGSIEKRGTGFPHRGESGWQL